MAHLEAGTGNIVLSKDWNKHKSGSTVIVDRVRGEWLLKNGYAEVENVEIENLPSKKAKPRERVSKSKTD